MNKYIIAIGGGELKTKTTLAIDAQIAKLAKDRAGDKRANALFFPTASYDSLPYFNTFRKTYTSELGLKVDVALLTKKDIPMEKIRAKLEAADMIYVGGGNTLHLMEVWRTTGIDKLIMQKYDEGVIIAGLSAGAICWFDKMYSDADIMDNKGSDYRLYNGFGVLRGTVSPHYDMRREDFDKAIVASGIATAYGIENNAAMVFENGSFKEALSAGGAAYLIDNVNGKLTKNIL